MSQPKTYEELCDLVETVNCDAAQYMRDVVPSLESFVPACRLDGAFAWADSAQTHAYWWCIEQIIGQDVRHSLDQIKKTVVRLRNSRTTLHLVF